MSARLHHSLANIKFANSLKLTVASKSFQHPKETKNTYLADLTEDEKPLIIVISIKF